MNAQYLVRFDDICPTMNWEMWSRIEKVLVDFGVSPILAVVPDNRDRKLMVAPSNPKFWDGVRNWQAKGWSIGLHGYQHLYVTRECGMSGFAGKSEFSGVAPEQQASKLREAIEIFRREAVTPEVWIAPAHSFDASTVAALARLGIRIISDGFALAPHVDDGSMFWIPQQLWKFRWRPHGIWTVCYHHNLWSEADFLRFCHDIERYRHAITTLSDVKIRYSSRRNDFLDKCYSNAHRAVLALKRRVRVPA